MEKVIIFSHRYLILSTFDITELMLWEIANLKLNEQKIIEESFLKIYEGIQELRNQTNMNITQMKKLFGYTSEMKLSEYLTGFPYRFKN